MRTTAYLSSFFVLWIYRMLEGLDLHIAKVVFHILPQLYADIWNKTNALFEQLCLESVQPFNC